MRSPSRDNREPSNEEKRVIKDYKDLHKDEPVRTTSAFHSTLPPHMQAFSLGFHWSRWSGQYPPFSYSEYS